MGENKVLGSPGDLDLEQSDAKDVATEIADIKGIKLV
jgi:hypothetical protein